MGNYILYSFIGLPSKERECAESTGHPFDCYDYGAKERWLCCKLFKLFSPPCKLFEDLFTLFLLLLCQGSHTRPAVGGYPGIEKSKDKQMRYPIFKITVLGKPNEGNKYLSFGKCWVKWIIRQDKKQAFELISRKKHMTWLFGFLPHICRTPANDPEVQKDCEKVEKVCTPPQL